MGFEFQAASAIPNSTLRIEFLATFEINNSCFCLSLENTLIHQNWIIICGKGTYNFFHGRHTEQSRFSGRYESSMNKKNKSYKHLFLKWNWIQFDILIIPLSHQSFTKNDSWKRQAIIMQNSQAGNKGFYW